MKKTSSKKKKSNKTSRLRIRNSGYSYTITPLGEPSARVTILYGDIEDFQYDTDWRNHSLVTLHGCTPEGAEIAVRCAFVARMKGLASPLFAETHYHCEEYALLRFWGEEGRSISQRFRDFAEDIEELEGIKNWSPNLQSFTRRLAQAHRKKQTGKTTPMRVDAWLLENWDAGKVACIFNNREITEMLGRDGIKHPEKKVAERMRALGLKKAKRPSRVKGYTAHSS